MVIFPLKMVIFPLKMVIFHSYVRKSPPNSPPKIPLPGDLQRAAERQGGGPRSRGHVAHRGGNALGRPEGGTKELVVWNILWEYILGIYI